MNYSPALPKRKAILVAEDDEAVRSLLADTLSEIDGWFVTTVANGNQAITVLETLHPDLVMLDVQMPERDGIEVYRILRMRTSLAAVPVLFVSAETPARTSGLQGIFYWLAKPFDLDDLYAVVTAILAGQPVGKPALSTAALRMYNRPEHA